MTDSWDARLQRDPTGAAQFLRFLMDTGDLEEVQAGVSRAFVGLGYENLTEPQLNVLRVLLNERGFDECPQCGEQIAFDEMIMADERGGMCAACFDKAHR